VAALAVASCVFATACGRAPVTASLKAVPLVAEDADPLDLDASGGDDEPSPLLEAIDYGDLSRVRELLATGEDVNQHDPVHGTPLIAALESGDQEIVAALLEAGARRDGTSAYFLAAAELPERSLDPEFRAVADSFAATNQLALRVHEHLPALLLCDVDDSLGHALVDQHQAELIERGWFLFRFARDARRRQDIIGLLPTQEKYVVLAYLRTDGLNYNIKTERIIDWLRRLEAEDPFVVTEAGLDYVGGRFLRRVRRPGQLAERMFAFCPDIVDQGVGSVANLETQLAKPAPPLYLWWD